MHPMSNQSICKHSFAHCAPSYVHSMYMQDINLTCNLFLQVWVERFREWMSKQVLQQLLVAAEQAHKVC